MDQNGYVFLPNSHNAIDDHRFSGLFCSVQLRWTSILKQTHIYSIVLVILCYFMLHCHIGKSPMVVGDDDTGYVHHVTCYIPISREIGG